MSQNSLQLKPSERRLLGIIGVATFVVLNFWFVFPHFKDWDKTKSETYTARRKLLEYQQEISQIPTNQTRLKELELQGSSVVPEEQANSLARTVQSLASKYQVNVISTRNQEITSQNKFFEEKGVTIRFANTGEKELVEFLVAIGSGDSLIRVRDLTITPERTQTRLEGSITLIASFQKP